MFKYISVMLVGCNNQENALNVFNFNVFLISTINNNAYNFPFEDQFVEFVKDVL